MAAAKWHEGPLGALDTETTGVNVYEDRIVTAAIVHATPGQRPRTITWVIDPGIDIPTEASDVHGWTTERLREFLGSSQAARVRDGRVEPMPREGALFEIAAQTATLIHTETPLVVANAAYDLTLLEAELTRHGIDTLASRPSGVRGVVDPMVLDKQHDPYRKGCYKAAGCRPKDKHHECGGCRGGKVRCGGCGATDRTLTSLCLHYGVRHTGAHDASADALAAVRLVPRIAAAWPDAARLKLPTLHSHQVTWRREQMDGLRRWFDKNGEEHDGCCGEWPVHSACAPARVGGSA